MAEEENYKLLTYVDPRKINVPIRERFAKLTLSNKKKDVEKIDEDGKFGEAAELRHDTAKRSSASCNLLKLLNDGETEPLKEVKIDVIKTSTVPHMNPLLISESSNSDDTHLNDTQLEEVCAGFMDEAVSNYMTGHRHPLPSHLLPMNDIDQNVDMLSRKVSLLSVSTPKPNTDAAGSKSQEDLLLVSTESQRISGDIKTQARKSVSLIVNRKENNDLSESICLLSSSENESQCCSVITVSDTSNLEADSMDFNLITSDIPASGETGDAMLPKTLSNHKADRLEAFLQDVSQQRHEIEAHHEENLHRSASNYEDSVLMENNPMSVGDRAKEVAYADTESMSACGTNDGNISPKMDYLETKRSIAQYDTVSMSKSDLSIPANNSDLGLLDNSLQQTNHLTSNSRRLAHNETEDNTNNTICDVWSDPEQMVANSTSHSVNCSEHIYEVDSSKQEEIPEESIVISESSSEIIDGVLTSNERRKKNVSSEASVHSSTTNSPVSPTHFQMDVGTINISAKINIKIAISQQISDSDCENNSYSSNDGSNRSGKKLTSLPASNEIIGCTPSRETQSQKSQNSAKVAINETKNIVESDSLEKSDDGEEEEFLEEAERILNEVYGQTWKTPDVIRSLKRPSRTVSGNQSSPTKQIPMPMKEKTTVKNNQNSNFEADNKEIVDHSLLDDFSIFRRNIEEYNMNSTFLVTPNVCHDKVQKRIDFGNINSGPRISKNGTENQKKSPFKVPQTGVKKVPATKTVKSKPLAERCRQIAEKSDLSGDNASDDESIDMTTGRDSSSECANDNYSDRSWLQNSSTSDDSEFEIPRRNRGKRVTKKKNRNFRSKSGNEIVYLDLTKEEVSVQDSALGTPAVNVGANFNNRLKDILEACTSVEKAKLPPTPTSTGKSKRKLFTANFGEEDVDLTVKEDGVVVFPKKKANDDEDFLVESEETPLTREMPKNFEIFNKHLEAIKRGNPIFKSPLPGAIKTPRTDTPGKRREKKGKSDKIERQLNNISVTPNFKYGFLKSLDVRVDKIFCHPDALFYRDNYRSKKEELTSILYDLYNENLFDNKLDVSLTWNKKLCNTAGRCLNKKKLGVRSSAIELSEKVLTSADRLRCTLIHEMCHAATWIFSGEGGHGSTWKQWAHKANSIFPEIPKIGVCHQYDIDYKYTYQCTLCGAKSHAHSKSKKVENIRCASCHGAIEIYLNKRDKQGNVIPTPVREATGFAKFVKENYKRHKQPDLKHAEIMKILSNEFAALKIEGKAN